MGSGLPGSLPSYLLYHLLLYMSYLANKIVVVVKYFVQKGSKVQCVSLDASKAFDKVLHHGLFVKLINKGVPAVFIRLLCNWYKHMTAFLQP